MSDLLHIPDAVVDADAFDFVLYRRKAEDAYRPLRGGYEGLAFTAHSLLTQALETANLKVHSIEQRAKSEESVGIKAARPSDTDPMEPKYKNPLSEIQDLAGCRVITFFLKDILLVEKVLSQEFSVVEKANRSAYLREAGKPGYESYHYIVEFTEARLALTEYARFRGMQVEIQVRTILQHAWAEIEHDIQYKSVDVLPESIGRRFMALAGMIEIGDREFQAIADDHESLNRQATTSIEQGKLDLVEVSPDSLKKYLDGRYGADGRMREWSYEWTTRVLKRLGFKTLAQLDEAIKPYSDDRVSRAIWGGRQGQLSRLEDVVMAAVGGDRFKILHPFSSGDTGIPGWFSERVDQDILKLEKAKIPVGTYSLVSGVAKPRH